MGYGHYWRTAADNIMILVYEYKPGSKPAYWEIGFQYAITEAHENIIYLIHYPNISLKLEL